MSKELQKVDNESLDLLKQNFPVEVGFAKISLPRLGMYSQDKTEGKGKKMVVTAEAGVFYTETQADEKDENGKDVWIKTELGTEIEGTIVFKRKQLKMYDSDTEKYTSSPVYDTDDEVLPLFCEKVEVARGTPSELKSKYEYMSEDGKTKSKLEENVILYVKYNNDIYQMNLRGSSMYSYKGYSRNVLPPSVLTRFSSESKSKGTIEWNQMKFETIRNLDNEEIDKVLSDVQNIKESIKQVKEYFENSSTNSPVQSEEDMEIIRKF